MFHFKIWLLQGATVLHPLGNHHGGLWYQFPPGDKPIESPSKHQEQEGTGWRFYLTNSSPNPILMGYGAYCPDRQPP